MRTNKTFKILSTVFLFTLSSMASAGFLVEPYLGYQLGSGDNNVATNSGSVPAEQSYNAPVLGARLGYSMLGFMGGIDYSMSSFDMEYEVKSNGATFERSFDNKQLGLFVGYELPILLRAWATYYLSAAADFTQGTSNYELSGGGFALGAGFTGLPFISLNAEMRSFSYDEIESSGISGNLSSKEEFKEYVISVSLPLDL